MKHKSLFHRLLQNTRRPEGFLGRIILRSMNRGHAPLIAWGLTHLSWQPDWTVLDIGCGGGAALAEILRRCPQGKAYGVDASPESVAFARKTNRTDLDTRCFIRQGTAGHLPFSSDAFDAATAFETVYFWEDLPAAFADTCRILKPAGRFLICCEASDPANTYWSSRIDGMTVRTADELRRLLEQAGFTDIALYRHGREAICLVAVKPA